MKCSKWKYCVMVLLALLALSSVAMAYDYVSYAEADDTAAKAADAAAPAAAPAPEKGPPLPFITIEGQGGGAFTPMAYLVNPAGECDVWGKPSVAFDYIGLGRKNLDALMVTENLLGRVEFGFAADRLGLGTLPTDINNTFHDPDLINNSDVWLYNFSARYMAVKENTCFGGFALPAITFGANFKYNGDIAEINNNLGGALTAIGYERDYGVDLTLTATKTLPKGFFGKPLIITGGLRESEAADLGFLGFSDQYTASFEGSVAALPFDKWLVAYEFRQKTSPYGQIGPGGTIDAPITLIGTENNWNGFDLAYIISNRATLVGGLGLFGNLANADANNAWWLQLKYEF
jgi:hypothetical protein